MGTRKSHNPCQQDAGFSLLQMLIAIGLASILVMIMASMMANQHRETRALQERLGGLELQNALVNVMASGDICMFVTNPPSGAKLKFNSTLLPAKRPQISVSEIPQMPVAGAPPLVKVGQALTSAGVPLKAKSIDLVILSGSGTKFFGQWQIQFAFEKGALVRSLPPVVASVALTADVSSPTAATITSCQGSDGDGGRGGSGSENGALNFKIDYGKCQKVPSSGSNWNLWKRQGLTNLTFSDMEIACPEGTVFAGADAGTKFSWAVCCPFAPK